MNVPKIFKLLLFFCLVSIPCAVALSAALDDYVWVSNANDNTVMRVHKEDLTRAQILTGVRPYGIRADENDVWVAIAHEYPPTLLRIRKSDLSSQTVTLEDEPYEIALDREYVWTANNFSNSITRIRKSDLSMTTVKVGKRPEGIAVDENHVWVTAWEEDTVLRIEKNDLSKRRIIPVGDEPLGVAVDKGFVWVSHAYINPGILTRIDKSDLSVQQIKAGESPSYGIAVDTTHIWTSNYYDDTVTRISKYDYSRTTLDVGEKPYGIALDNDYVWVATLDDDTLSCIDKSDLSVTEIRMDDHPIRVASGYCYDYSFPQSPCKPVEVTEPASDVTVSQGEIVQISWKTDWITADTNMSLSPSLSRQTALSVFRRNKSNANPILQSGSTVSLYYDTDSDFAGIGKILITKMASEDESFLWDTVGVTPGTYHIVAAVDDGICLEFDYAVATVTITAPIEETDEGFEGGDFEKYPWLHGGAQPWDLVSDTQIDGTYSAKSGYITNNETSVLEVNLEVDEGFISFYRKISSEQNYDRLVFYIDGFQAAAWSGTSDWTYERFPVSSGPHRFTWIYEKDADKSSGEDGAWIDNIGFPPSASQPLNHYVWVANPYRDQVTRISTWDLSTHVLDVGDFPRYIAMDDDYVWISSAIDDKVTRIKKTDLSATRISVGDYPATIAVDTEAVWVVNQFDHTITRIDKSDLSKITIETGPVSYGIAVDPDSIWVTNTSNDTLTKIDKSDYSMTVIDVGNDPNHVAVDTHYAWVSNWEDGTVMRVDKSDSTIRTISVGNNPYGIAADTEAVWVANSADNEVARLDKTDLTVTKIPVGETPWCIAVDEKYTWVGNHDSDFVTRISKEDLSTHSFDIRNQPLGIVTHYLYRYLFSTSSDTKVQKGGYWVPPLFAD